MITRDFAKLVVVICCFGFPPARSFAQPSQQATPTIKPELTAEQASALEENLKTNPDDLATHEKLITYYFEAMLASRSPDLEQKREDHVFWLIEHHPDSALAGSPEAQIQPVGITQSSETYERAKDLWLRQVDSHPDNVNILSNAARFLALWDRKEARELLEKVLLLNPKNTQAASELAQSYMMEGATAQSSEEKMALAEKALSVQEAAEANTSGEERFYALDKLAEEALEAGNAAKAEQYATELLQLAPQYKRDWNYGNAVHKGNIILGRIALQRGDLLDAKQRLLAAGATPGSPQLDSFGPNMTLAKELLEKGERDAVVSYLESCGRFWKMGGTQLQDWITTVKAGGVPDFGANLSY